MVGSAIVAMADDGLGKMEGLFRFPNEGTYRLCYKFLLGMLPAAKAQWVDLEDAKQVVLPGKKLCIDLHQFYI